MNEQGAVVARLATQIKLYKLHQEHRTANRILSEVHRLVIALRLHESHIDGNQPVSFKELQAKLQEELGKTGSQELTALESRLKYHLTALQKAGYVDCCCSRCGPIAGNGLWRDRKFGLTGSGLIEIERFAKRFPDSYGSVIDIPSSDGPADTRQNELGAEVVLAFPIHLADDDGAGVETLPDFPELACDGRRRSSTRVADAIHEAIAARIANGESVPVPSEGHAYVTLPTLTAIKAYLHERMRANNISKAELADRLGWDLPSVERLLDINDHSRLDWMEAAFKALGYRLTVMVKDGV